MTGVSELGGGWGWQGLVASSMQEGGRLIW